MNPRDQQVLKIVLESYIQEGNPVSSKMITEKSALGLSSASIRNILSALEDEGYLISPHTSSGRIPTALGYRFFIESLLTVKPLAGQEVKTLVAKLDPQLSMPDLLQSASSTLSGLTQLISVVTLPRRNRTDLRHVEFLSLSHQRVLVVLVLNSSEVQNRIIVTDRSYTPSELQQAANYLNVHYIGKDLLTIRTELMTALQEDRDSIARFTQIALNMLSKTLALATDDPKDCLIDGQNNLLNHIKEVDLGTLRGLFDTFKEKQEILELLDRALAAEGVQILIGKESGLGAQNDWSVVTKSYSVEGEVVGALGVIGPLRMPYDRVISAVDLTAKLLSAALNQA